jgi:hypothetical protein
MRHGLRCSDLFLANRLHEAKIVQNAGIDLNRQSTSYVLLIPVSLAPCRTDRDWRSTFNITKNEELSYIVVPKMLGGVVVKQSDNCR